MHAAIDYCRKNVKIFAPCQWPAVIQMARSSQPYNVREVERHEFYDTRRLAKSLNTKLAKYVPWTKVKCIRVSKVCADCVEIKEDYDEDYRKVPLWTYTTDGSQWMARRRKPDDGARLPCTIPSGAA